jgi:hypothetical protein
LATDWRAIAGNIDGGNVQRVLSAPSRPADPVTGLQPPIQVTENKRTFGQKQRSRMGPAPPLELGPLWKTTNIVVYKILLIGNPYVVLNLVIFKMSYKKVKFCLKGEEKK